jgi:hypothetical protein
MYRLDIIDDYIRVDALKEIEPALLEVKPWYFGSDSDWDDPNRKITLAHIIHREDFTPVEKYFIKALSKDFDTSKIGRGYYNCFRKCDNPGFHTDPGGNTYMFYINYEWDESWGGHTEFKSKETEVLHRIIPKPGRLVVFDARWTHRGTEPTSLMPDRVIGRLSLAFQEREGS